MSSPNANTVSFASARPSQSGAGSSHRLPTLTLSSALASISSEVSLATGLPLLDAALDGTASSLSSPSTHPRGLRRGKVYEAFGPPGSGKTAIGIQVACSALIQLNGGNGEKVVWIDTAHPLDGPRLRTVLERSQSALDPPATDTSTAAETNIESHLRRFTHIRCPSLAHFLALLSPVEYPSSTATILPSEKTALIVIDTFSAPLSTLSTSSASSHPNTPSHTYPKWPSPRAAATSTLLRHAAQLAAQHRCVVLLLNDARTMRVQYPSTGGEYIMGLTSAITPAIGSTASLALSTGEGVLAGRIMLFRDFPPPPSAEGRKEDKGDRAAWFASLLQGSSSQRSSSLQKKTTPVSFVIDEGGLHPLSFSFPIASPLLFPQSQSNFPSRHPAPGTPSREQPPTAVSSSSPLLPSIPTPTIATARSLPIHGSPATLKNEERDNERKRKRDAVADSEEENDDEEEEYGDWDDVFDVQGELGAEAEDNA